MPLTQLSSTQLNDGSVWRIRSATYAIYHIQLDCFVCSSHCCSRLAPPHAKLYTITDKRERNTYRQPTSHHYRITIEWQQHFTLHIWNYFCISTHILYNIKVKNVPEHIIFAIRIQWHYIRHDATHAQCEWQCGKRVWEFLDWSSCKYVIQLTFECLEGSEYTKIFTIVVCRK